MIATSVLSDIQQSYSYPSYKQIVVHQAENSQSSGEQSKEHIEATHINAQRIKRIDKTYELNSELKKIITNLKNTYSWVLLAESWCGDGAQCIPVIAKMAEINPNITLQIIFRDEHPDIMNAFLTNGSKSIPKLICVNTQTSSIVGTWGPRPKAIQEMVIAFKKENPYVSHEEFVKNLHLWYARDKSNALQSEFIDMLKKWDSE